MCNACAVAEAVRLRPMVCIGDVAPGGDIHPARCSGIYGAGVILRVAGPGGMGCHSTIGWCSGFVSRRVRVRSPLTALPVW